jgi:hypothetical protein
MRGGEIMRRYGYPLYGKQFVGNSNTTEVHDLDNEKTGPTECQINEIISAGHARTFNPDTLEQAHQRGYDNCHYCIGGSRR